MNRPSIVLPYQRSSPAIDPQARFFAHRTLRVLGPLCTFMGLTCAFPPAMYMAIHPSQWLMLVPTALSGLLCLSGVTYWICSARIRSNSLTAARVALVIAWTHMGFFLTWMLLSLIAMVAGAWTAVMPLIMGALFCLGLVDLIRQLRRCVRAFAYLPQSA